MGVASAVQCSLCPAGKTPNKINVQVNGADDCSQKSEDSSFGKSVTLTQSSAYP